MAGVRHQTQDELIARGEREIYVHYGEGMGRYGFDPVVLIHTSHDVRAGKMP